MPNLAVQVTEALKKANLNSGVEVGERDGNVVLRGHVRNVADHAREIAAAWAVAGVKDVSTELTIEE